MTRTEFPTVAITGATGYLGGVLGERAGSAKSQVIRLSRTPSSEGSARFFRLDADPPTGLLDGVDLLVHCAYDMAIRDPREIMRVNVDGTRRLLDVAVAAGVSRVVVLSSMSAYEGTEQVYGRAKLQIERDALDAGAVTVRPGLVYGPRAGGMVGTLRRLTKLFVVPLVGGQAVQFTVHEDDFAEALWALATVVRVPGVPIGIANPVPVLFRHLLERLAWEQGRTPRFVPVHWRLLQSALVMAELAGLPVPVRSDSLLGLVQPASSVPNLEVLSELGIHLRRFGQPVPPAGGIAIPSPQDA
jgi:nucleoside-diphosphate-sugar epimerase